MTPLPARAGLGHRSGTTATRARAAELEQGRFLSSGWPVASAGAVAPGLTVPLGGGLALCPGLPADVLVPDIGVLADEGVHQVHAGLGFHIG